MPAMRVQVFAFAADGLHLHAVSTGGRQCWVVEDTEFLQGLAERAFMGPDGQRRLAGGSFLWVSSLVT